MCFSNSFHCSKQNPSHPLKRRRELYFMPEFSSRLAQNDDLGSNLSAECFLCRAFTHLNYIDAVLSMKHMKDKRACSACKVICL